MKKHPSPNAKAQQSMGEIFAKPRDKKYDALASAELTTWRRRIEDHLDLIAEKRELL